MRSILQRLVQNFPFLLLGFASIGYWFPEYFLWFQGNWIVFSLGIVMW